MTRSLATALILALAAATPAAARDTPDVELQKALAGRVAGEPTDCIMLSSVGSSRIIPGKGILYRVGSTLYLNEPRSGADRLDDDDILVTQSYGSQLCSIDTVTLVGRAARFPTGFVILGRFVPYTKVKPAS